ncbi:uncharacterized protein LOC122129333 [Clupea harengus]|uniref:Uncharacterized protein LOC122129333 n=1 Tax=Clupea harengus TaxID=7950 RepID=A0A8M1KCP1_CLUHA|nr:uncharacterized protein LOC122129333 [Clupea harengus]
MAGQTERWRALWLLLLVCLALQTVEFELTEEDWEELPASLLSLHRLKGLHDQITHEATPDTNIPLLRSAMFLGRIGARRLSAPESVLQYKTTEKDIFEDLKGCQDLPQCLLQKEQDFKGFLAHVEGQKLQDVLLSASELSSNYQNKVLLMMDEEAETLQRAEEEYLKDPLNSMKFGQACLFNDSCLMKVRRDTVVRIFGRTSEDGSSVSDHGGSILATILLQTELKTASLFSIDGKHEHLFSEELHESI